MIALQEPDAEFQVSLKKLTKKDEVTRLKGLHELRQLVESDTDGRSSALLLPWSQTFSRLMLDPERRVREASVELQGALALKLKKEVLPFFTLFVLTPSMIECTCLSARLSRTCVVCFHS